MAYTDTYALAGFILMCFPFISYYFVASAQHANLNFGTLRTQILCARTALMLPSYAFFIWISLLDPEVGPALEVPIAVAEGKNKHHILIEA